MAEVLKSNGFRGRRFLGLAAAAGSPESGVTGELVDSFIALQPGMTRHPVNPYVSFDVLKEAVCAKWNVIV